MQSDQRRGASETGTIPTARVRHKERLGQLVTVCQWPGRLRVGFTNLVVHRPGPRALPGKPAAAVYNPDASGEPEGDPAAVKLSQAADSARELSGSLAVTAAGCQCFEHPT